MSVAPDEGDPLEDRRPRGERDASASRPGWQEASSRGSLLVLAGLVGLTVAAHLVVLARAPIVKTFGDEASYTREAHRHIDDGAAQLLPGRMLFHHRPPFAFHFFAMFAERELITHPEREPWIIENPHESWSPAMTRFVRAVSLAHLVLLLATGIGVYALCALVGGGAVGANVAAAFVLLHPRLGFFVQSLWAEILHMALLVAGLLLLVSAVARRRSPPDLPTLALVALAGATLAYAALTRGVVAGFSWLVGPWLAVETFLADRRAAGGGVALARGALLAALFFAVFQGTLAPQRLANLGRHGTTLIAHNTWRNIEAGLIGDDGYIERYKAASDHPAQREALARERVLRHVRESPKLALAARQTGSFVRTIDRTFVERGVRQERWGAGVAAGAAAAAASWASWGVFVLGIAGLAWRGASSAGSRLVAAFCLYYMAGLLVVIPNVRMFVQLVPPLAVFAGLAVDGLARRGGPPRPGAS